MEAGLFITIIFVFLLFLVVLVLFLNRFYQKSSLDRALVRTGLGGRKVLIDGGALVLPLFHQVQWVNMRALPVSISLMGESSAMTSDRLRVNIEVEFLIRVSPEDEKISYAAQSLGSRITRSDDLAVFVDGYLRDAIQSVVSHISMDDLHDKRKEFTGLVRDNASGALSNLGLLIEAVSLKSMDQVPFGSLDDNNMFNARGMKYLSDTVSRYRRERVQSEVEVDIAIRNSHLHQTRERLAIERQEKEAEINLHRETEELKALSEAEVVRLKSDARLAEERARVSTDQKIKTAEIEKDKVLRFEEMKAILALESNKVDNAIALANKRIEETRKDAEAERVRTELIEAVESTQTNKDIMIARRKGELSILEAERNKGVDRLKTDSDILRVQAMAEAEAKAQDIKTESDKLRKLSESEGARSLIEAENAISSSLMSMKLEMERIRTLPELATQMMKPVEKIDSIRINQIGGLGGDSSGVSNGMKSPLDQAMESILSMAVQLPAMKNLGQEIGLELDPQLAGRMADAAGRIKGSTSHSVKDPVKDKKSGRESSGSGVKEASRDK